MLTMKTQSRPNSNRRPDVPYSIGGIKSNMANVQLSAQITPYRGPKSQLISRLWRYERLIPGRTGIVEPKNEKAVSPKKQKTSHSIPQMDIDLNSIIF